MYYSSGENEATFKKSLTKEQIEIFEKEKKDMEKIIETRKEYIKQFIDKNGKTYNQLKQAIASNNAMDCVEQILADSKVYSYLKSEDTEPYISNYKKMDVQQYKEAYKKKLSEEYPTEFQMFEKLKKENPNHLQEICS
jgi:trans-aconitate methyltransferase